MPKYLILNVFNTFPNEGKEEGNYWAIVKAENPEDALALLDISIEPEEQFRFIDLNKVEVVNYQAEYELSLKRQD